MHCLQTREKAADLTSYYLINETEPEKLHNQSGLTLVSNGVKIWYPCIRSLIKKVGPKACGNPKPVNYSVDKGRIGPEHCLKNSPQQVNIIMTVYLIARITWLLYNC